MDETNLCPNCFVDLDYNQTKCPSCGFVIKDNSNKNIFSLPPMSIIADRYILGKVIGSGGFGITYKAKDLLTDEICAVKEYLPFDWVHRKDGDTLYSNSTQKKTYFESGKKKFLDEAKMLLKFKDEDNIINVKNFFSCNNTAYLVMEYLNGADFRRIIKNNGNKISFSAAKEVFIEVARALETIHKHDVLHRDVSAENIFVTEYGGVKLIDFGSARQLDREHQKNMSVMLKTAVAPIEQYSSSGNQGPWTDIYSLASTFYAAVSGMTVPSAPQRAKEDTLKPLSEVCTNVPKVWSDVIEKSLNIEPEKRYSCISEMFVDLNTDAGEISFKKNIAYSDNKKVPYLIIEKSKLIKSEAIIKKLGSDEYCIGRSIQKSDLVVDMVECVSRRHCCIKYNYDNDVFLVKDISVNGTFFENGHRMRKDYYETVTSGSIIYLGSMGTVVRLVSK